MLIRTLTMCLMLVAFAAAASAQAYDKDGSIDDLKLGEYFWGDEVTLEDLEQKVVLVQIAGL